MDFLEIFGLALLVSPISELFKSMRRSKTLTIMVIIGLTFFIGFTIFPIKMASLQ